MPSHNPQSINHPHTIGKESLQFCVLNFAFCVLTSCSFLPTTRPAFYAALGPQDTAKPADAGLTSVVRLIAIGPAGRGQNRECSATGFLIDAEGYLITAAHVVDDARHCLERAPGAKILAKLTVNDSRTAPAVPVEVIGIDAANDLALLKTQRPLTSSAGEKPPFAKLDARAVAVGTEVSVSGYPAFSWQAETQTGQILWSGKTQLDDADSNSPSSDALMLAVRLRPGNSGSPVYLPDGGVIGVIDKRDSLRPAYSIGVAIHYAIELAQRYGAPWHGVD
jgi:serine protease Do